MSTRNILYCFYSIVAYLVGMVSLAYLAGFMLDVPLPKTLNGGTSAPLPDSWVTNVLVLVAFLVPHSIMARPGFKQRWTRIVPAQLERATYILFSGLSLLALIWAWQPLPQTLWHLDGFLWWAVYAAYAAAWLIILFATFHIDHLFFFGLRQVWTAIQGRGPRQPSFTGRWLYGLVRHPISVGWLLVFWATPHMTVGHLVIAACMSLYIFTVTPLEEADLVVELGDDYVQYQARVPRFLPWPRARRGAAIASRRAS